MNKVELIINPFEITNTIKINDKSISIYSELANYLKEPFYNWCDKILDSISRELNDDYELTIVSRRCEKDILFKLAEKHEECRKVIFKEFKVNTSILDRIKKLTEIVNSKQLNFNTETLKVNLFFLDEKDEFLLKDYFSNVDLYCATDKNSFIFDVSELVKIEFKVLNFKSSLFENGGQSVNILFIDEHEKNNLSRETIYNLSGIFILSSNFSVKKNMNTFYYEFKEEDFNNTLYDFLEFKLLTPYFNRLLQKLETEYSFQEIFSEVNYKLLKCIEPIVEISCANSLEVNTSTPVNVKCYPEDFEIPELEYSYSKEGIVLCKNNILYALSPGEVEVNFYIKGKNEPVKKLKINVFKRNKITSLEIDKKSIITGRYEKIKLYMKFFPHDADNTEELKWTSSNPHIASVDEDGIVTTHNIGTCLIIISTNDVSAKCEIIVKPNIEEIIVSPNYIELFVGEEEEIQISYNPIDVLNNNIFWETSDKTVAIYNKDKGTIKAIGIGNAKINFYTEDRKVYNFCEVNVKSTFDKNKKNGNPSLTFSIILFILSFFLYKVRFVNYLLPIFGTILGINSLKSRESDNEASKIFIFLNIIALLVIIYFNNFAK